MQQLLGKLLSPASIVRALVSGLLVYLVIATWLSLYGFAYDGQEERCLPWKLMFLYPVGEEPIERGDLVQFIAMPPNFFGKLNGGSAGKMVAGVPGDHVQIKSGRATINETPLLDLEDRTARRLQREIDSFDADYVLGQDEYFVVGTLPHSFDSRYWGPIKRAQIQKRLVGIL